MPKTTTPTAPAAPPTESDPYALRAEDVREAPRTFTGRLRHLGPGFVLSAAVVGSGELIVTTSLGAEAGFVLLWLVVVSTAVKVWVRMELARWTILNGRTALDGYRDVGPRIGRLGWINWLWIGMDFATAAHDPDPDVLPAAGLGVVLPVGAVAGADGADRWHRRRCLPARRGDRGLAAAAHRRRQALPRQPVVDAALTVSSAAIVFLGVYGVLDVFGISLAGS